MKRDFAFLSGNSPLATVIIGIEASSTGSINIFMSQTY
jgi:hypothetical protein|tara:strand:+ start:454 stop:567 length:114 start_codon:yes stop_codon:yes gene_type:complete